MDKELREAIKLLNEEVRLLRRWARESRTGGWSTHQVQPMRDRARHLEYKINELEARVITRRKRQKKLFEPLA